MNRPRLLAALGRDRAIHGVGALVCLGVAIALYTRYSIDILLNRDEAIYAYGGQQLTHGVPPYASIFDPKTPLATMLCGLGAAIGHVLGRDDVYLIRLVFLACACLTVVAMYLLAARLFRSVLAGLVAAVTFASFAGFARDAIAGPDAKTPGVLLTVVTMWLLLRRQWFWAGVAAGLAFLDWQPFVFYALAVLLVPVLQSESGARWRSLWHAALGALLPLAVTFLYFTLAGALGKFVESAIDFPATGVNRGPAQSLGARLAHIASVIHQYYNHGIVFWAGVGALALVVLVHLIRTRSAPLAALRDPLICVVALTGVAEAGYAVYDFQSYPDVYALLAYPALGLGGLAALLAGAFRRPAVRRATTAVIGAVAVALVVVSWRTFSTSRANNHAYLAQRGEGCAVDRVLVPGTPLYSLGDPTPLVVTHRRNPDRFIFLASGVASWKIDHMKGGFAAWVDQIRASRASVIVIMGWEGQLRAQLADALRGMGFKSGWIGSWYVFLDQGARARAESAGVLFSSDRSDTATDISGRPITCAKP